MYDLAIIGGGINGTGIARDAAGRGLKVVLVERDDLAAHTSSASTKLVHGGLRYLEQYEFNLVRKALKEREVLLRSAPHIIWPMRFVLPVDRGMRPAWLLRMGLWLYDHLGSRELLPGTDSVDLRRDDRGAALQPRLERGFAYSDCWVEDARLVVLNARDAAARGADIRTRTECTGLARGRDSWTLELDGGEETIEARKLVNAAGPWVDPVTALYESGPAEGQLRLVKGSHIVIARKFPGDHAYIFQNADGRVVFAIPYETDFTLVGTTDQPWSYDEGPAAISDAEVRYLCAAASEYFTQAVVPDDVLWTYSGVRPLYDDRSQVAARVTRDYVFGFDDEAGAPVLSIFGGKITTYRVLAEEALAKLFPGKAAARWTGRSALPGGDFAIDGVADLTARYAAAWPFLKPATARRYVRAYGTDTERMLDGVRSVDDLGEPIAADLYARELDWMIEQEFARTGEDCLWRRSKLGLHLVASERQAVTEWVALRTGTPAPSPSPTPAHS